MFTKNWYVCISRDNVCTEQGFNSAYRQLVDTNGNQLVLKTEVQNDITAWTLNNQNIYYTSLESLTRYFPKLNKSEWINDTSYRTGTTSYSPYGIVFGNGTEAESANDYTMSGDLFTTYSVSSATEYIYDENGSAKTILLTLTNTGTEDFTISEIGLVGYCYEYYNRTGSTSSASRRYYYNTLLFERTLLENPITIPANGGVGQVTYTIQMNYPVG